LETSIIKLLDWFYKPFEEYLSRQTFRYAACGGANTMLDIVLYFVAYNFVFEKQMVNLGILTMSPHIAAFVFVFPITFTSGFVLSKYITFTESTLRGHIQLFRYVLTVLGSVVLNYMLLKFFVESLNWYPTISKIVTTGMVIVYSYVCQKYFTFRMTIKA